MKKFPVLAGTLCALLTTTPILAEVKPVDATEAENWLYQALPLPREIKIAAKNVVAPADIAIRIGPNADSVVKNAKKTLEDFFKEKTGSAPSGEKFEIVLGTIDGEGKVAGHPVTAAARLKTLPNNDQAYAIEPSGDNRLLVAALNAKGVFYGAQTLRQLLGGAISADSVAVPMATIVDWPDFAVRGLWNGGTYKIYPRLAEIKLNYAKNYGDSAGIGLNANNEPVFKKINRDLVLDARDHAFDAVPNISHLNFIPIACPSLYKVYPELAGKGPEAIQKTNTPYPCPCASNPLLAKLLAGWLREYAKVGVRDVSVWTSEYRCRCDCPNCAAAVPDKEARQMALEARAIATAWREVQKEFPDFKVRILGFPLAILPDCSNAGVFDAREYARILPAVMKEIPKEMVVEQVYPRQTLKGGKYADAIDAFAADGYKIVAYTLVPGAINHLYRSPAGVVEYIPSFLDRKWYGVCAWDSMDGVDLAFDQEIGSHGMFAIAEWGWNARGRSLKDFFRAWATTRGMNNPEKVGEWGEIVSPLDWTIRDFRYHYSTLAQMKGFIDKLKAGTSAIAVTYPKALKAKDAVARLDKAMELAKSFKNERMALSAEELSVLYRELWLMAELEATPKAAREKRAELARSLGATIAKRDAVSKRLLASLKNYRIAKFFSGGEFQEQIKALNESF